MMESFFSKNQREKNPGFFQSNFSLKSRKGELSTQQIIMLIILIASFVVILFFLFRLNLGSESDEDICHNSVVTRGSSVIPSESVPLKCSTSYVCITEDGSCEGLNNPEIHKVKTENEVYAVLADEMADCWWMFGAGEIDYVQDDLKQNHYCSICSQILFDDSLEEIEEFGEGNMSKDSLYDFLAIAEYSEEQTYAQYIFGTNDMGSLKNSFAEEHDFEGEVSFGNIEIGKQYFNVMGIVSEVSTFKLILAGVGLGVGIAVLAPVGFVGGAIIATGGGTAGGIIGDDISEFFKLEIVGLMVEGKGIDNQFLAPTIIEIDSEKFDALDCTNVKTLS